MIKVEIFYQLLCYCYLQFSNLKRCHHLIPNYNFQMYGRYTKDLGEYAKDEARKLKILERRRKQEDKARNKVSER